MFFSFWSQQYCSISKGFLKSKNKNPLKRGDLESDESLKIKEAANNEWEAEKIMQVKRAEADKESKILIGQWMAGQRMEIAKWFRESVEMIKWADDSLDWDKILKFLLDSSRIETLNNIWNSDKTKLVYLNEDLEWRAMNKEAKLIAWSELMR